MTVSKNEKNLVEVECSICEVKLLRQRRRKSSYCDECKKIRNNERFRKQYKKRQLDIISGTISEEDYDLVNKYKFFYPDVLPGKFGYEILGTIKPKDLEIEIVDGEKRIKGRLKT